MAKKTDFNAIDNTPDPLAKDRQQFEKEIEQRIKLGDDLVNREVSNQPALSKLKDDYDLWNNYNAELVKRAFNKQNNECYREYSAHGTVWVTGMFGGRVTFEQLVNQEKQDITDRINRLKKIQNKLPLIAEVSNLPKSGTIIDKTKTALENLTKIFDRFHKVAQSLRHRHNDRETLIIKDEYDVQDLLRSLLQLNFSDVREEDYSPSYAGGNSRIDFVLKEEQIVIETKMTNESLKDKEIGNQLSIDIVRYRAHPDCKTLVIFIYDRGDHIRNKSGLIGDLQKLSNDQLVIKIKIEPS